MKSQDLKKSILQYAMQGKLVPQDSNDEPASELLKRIKAEKEQLIKDGKIKKEKPLPPITQDEIPYDLPQGWQWVRLGNVTLVRGGKRVPAGYQLQKATTDFVYIRVTDMQNYSINCNDLHYISNEIRRQIEQYIITDKDVYLTIAGTIGRVGIIPAKLNNMNLTENAVRVTPFLIFNKFLMYLLDSSLVQSQFIEKTNQLGQPKLAIIRIKNTIVPLPPLAEQKRIVEKLEKILPLVDEYGKNEEILSEMNQKLPKQIRQSILQYAVQGKLVEQNPQDEPASELLKRIKAEKDQLIKDGKIKKEKPLPPITQDEIPYDLPQGWQWVRFQDIVQKIGSGSTPKGGKQIYTKNGIKFIRSQNVYNDGLKLDDIAFISEEINKKMQNTIVKPKDILLNITGGSIGRSCLIDDNFDIANVNQHVSIVRPVNEALRHFMHLYIISPVFFSIIMEQQNGISREGFSKTMHERCLFPLPPLAEQRRIVAKVEELLNLVNKLEVS